MAKTTAQLNRELAALVAGDADLEGRADAAKAIKKRGKLSTAVLLGYTQSGLPVFAPTGKGVPNTNDVTVFQKTKAKFAGWSKADFMDASAIYEAQSRADMDAGNYERSRQLSRWSSVLWDIGGRWTGPEFEARHPPR